MCNSVQIKSSYLVKRFADSSSETRDELSLPAEELQQILEAKVGEVFNRNAFYALLNVI